MYKTIAKLSSFIIGLYLSLTVVYAAPNQAALDAAWKAAGDAAQYGPTEATIGNQAKITIPEHYAFVPKAQGNQVMKALGNGESPDLYGLIVPTGDGENAMYTVEFKADGYVKDDDAKNLDPDDILKNYQEGTEQSNAERVRQGFPALEVSGWAQKPVYDAQQHRLTWAMIAHDKGASTEEDGVNYETRILGRDGVISITLLAESSKLNSEKIKADALTAGLHYNDGKKYADFSESAGDKVAKYGLATLITGVVAKKLGLFAVIVAFLAKFAKIGIIALFAAFPFLRKVFKRKEKHAKAETEHVAPQADDPVMPATTTQEAAKQSELTDTTKL